LEWVAVGPNKGGLVERFWRLVEVQTAANLTNLASRFPDAVELLASVLLPAIFNDSQDVSVQDYRDTIIRNPWLVKVLFNAFKNGQFHDVQRIGLCGSYIARPPPLNLPVDLRCLPLAAPGKEEQTRRESRFH
jgi:hypothetical protein